MDMADLFSGDDAEAAESDAEEAEPVAKRAKSNAGLAKRSSSTALALIEPQQQSRMKATQHKTSKGSYLCCKRCQKTTKDWDPEW